MRVASKVLSDLSRRIFVQGFGGNFMAKKRIFTISFVSVVGLLAVLGGYWVFGSLFAVDKTIHGERLARVEQGSVAKSVVATEKIEPLFLPLLYPPRLPQAASLQFSRSCVFLCAASG